MNKKIGLLTWEKYEGRRNIGSSRIRGKWLVNHWDNAEIYKQGAKYDVMIYQKCYWVEHAKDFSGIKILDLCDPDWLHWGYRVKEMLDNVDAITTSTEALAEDLRNFTDKPVICIPDRLDFDTFKIKKIHEGDAKYVVWYGYSTNWDLLKQILVFLAKYNLNLIVISDKNFQIPSHLEKKIKVENFKWNIETVNNDIIKGDIVVNPASKNGKWKYKSNNKTVNAWALDMPVADNVEDLKKFIKYEERIKEVEKRKKEIQEKYDIKQSVSEYEKLIKEIKEKNNK